MMHEHGVFLCPFTKSCGARIFHSNYPSKNHFRDAAKDHLRGHLMQIENNMAKKHDGARKETIMSGPDAEKFVDVFHEKLRESMERNKQKLVWK